MKRSAAFAAASAIVLSGLLAACGSGQVRRVSEPAAGIQQLTVHADGHWSVALRIDNFSSVPMRFDQLSLALTIDGQSAGTLQGNAGIGIGPESADVTTLTLVPSATARLHMGDALAARRSVDYTLRGRLDAAPEGGGARSYEIDRSSVLSPVPGLPGVLR